MAILSVVPGHKYSLRGVLEYIYDDKLHNNRVTEKGGIGISNLFDAYDEMLLIKTIYNSTDKVEYLHIVLSLEKNECRNDVQPFTDICTMYCEFLHNLFCSQVVFAIHQNTANTHAHFIVNSVNYYDGKKVHISFQNLMSLIQYASDLLFRIGCQPCRVKSEE